MSDDEQEPTHCFSYQGNKIYVVIDGETTEEDLGEALVENLELPQVAACFQESKYETYVSLAFIIKHRSNISIEYGTLEAITESTNADIAWEVEFDNIMQQTKDNDLRIKNNAMRKLCILGRDDTTCPKMIKQGIIPVLMTFFKSRDSDLQTAACGVVLNLAFEDEIKEQLAEAGIIHFLAQLVQSETVALHRAAAGAIRNIACDHEGIIEAIANCQGVLDRLIKLLESPLLDVKAVAAAALRNLAAKESLRQTIAHKGALNSLMQLIQVQNEEVQRGAAGCLAYLAEDSQIRDQISRQDAVSALLPLLMMNTNDEQLLANTARAIAKLALDDANCIEIGKKGGIPVFVKLLDSTSSEVLRWACNAIYNLAVHDLNSRLLGESKAISILIGLLSHAEIEVRKNAMGALWNLSARDENALKIAASGGAPPIISLLDSDVLEIIRRVLPCVGNLARQDSLKKTLAELGAVKKALHWLGRSKHDEILDNAAFVLQGLASLESTSQEIEQAEGIKTILEVMKNAKPALCLALGNCLLALSYYENHKQAIAAAGGVETLVNLLKASEPEMKITVQPILGSLAFDDNITQEIANQGAISLLVANLNDKNKKVQSSAVDALANLSTEEKTRNEIVENNGIEPILTFLASKTNATVECAIRTLLNVSSEEQHIPALLSAGILEKVKPLVKSSDKDIIKIAVSTFRNLSTPESSAESFINDDVIPVLFEVLHKDKNEVEIIKPALEALVNLSSDDKCASEITRVSNGVNSIVEYLSNPSPECQGYAAVITCNIARNPDIIYTISKRALPLLLDLLKCSDTFCQIQAAAALHYLAQQESNKVDLCACENFSYLFHLLDTSDERARNASWALEQLVGNAECALTIVKKIGMPTLVKYLSSANTDVKNGIIFVIYKALRADMNLKASIKEAGAASALQNIEKTSEKRIASFASYMLQVINK